MTVGERIKGIRNRLGMSQVSFADKLNVSKQTLYKYENNIITNIPSDKIEIAARLGNVSPAYLMGWDNNTSFDSNEKEEKILDLFSLLNESGQDKALEQIELLTKIPEYKSVIHESETIITHFNLDDEDFKENYMVNAANQRTDIDIPEGVDTSEDDIMDSDEF